MCNPTAIAAISVVATGLRAFGVIQQTRAATAQADFKTRIAQNNATIAANNADRVREKAEVDIQEKRRETRQRLGLQRAQIAAAGFDLGSATTFDILGDTAALGELDVLRIDEDAENRAANFEAQGAGFQTEAALGRLQAKDIRRGGRIGLATTLITGAVGAGSILARKPVPTP